MKLSLGTVQFGLDYGVNNTRGKVPKEEVFEILNYCLANGIDVIDTAYSYGDSESVIGQWLEDTGCKLKVISKLPALDDFSRQNVEAIFNHSLNRLHIQSIYGYLIHRFEDFVNYEGLWHVLEGLKECGLVEKIGFSLYHPEEIEIIFDEGVNFDIVQVPYSIFDRRFSPFFEALRQNNIETYVRSVFLQGMFFVEPDSGLNDKLVKARPYVKAIQKLSAETGIPVGALCLNFALLNRYVDKVIIGVDSLKQLKENLQHTKLTEKVEALSEKLSNLAIEDEQILLPYNWSR